MNQIIIDGVLLPETSRDRYSCWEETLTRQVTMISGRVVVEAIGDRNKIWKASYSYDYMGNDLLRRALEVLRSGAPFMASVLTDDRDEMVTSSFVVTELSQPTMAFSRKDNAFWHNLSFTIREVHPHG